MNRIDDLFSYGNNEINIFKEEFYLGKICRVYRDSCYLQTDNFSLLKSRVNRNDYLIPNTINYLVVINSASGVYLAEVISSQLNDGTLNHDALMNQEDDSLHPMIQLKLIGIYGNDGFKLSGFNNVGIGDKVYIATAHINELYLSSIEISKSKYSSDDKLCFSNMATTGSSKIQFRISANSLLSNHLMILGATNSGKSTTALSILDQLNKQNVRFILIDPTGEYNESFPETEVEPLILGDNTFLKTGSVTSNEWIMLFNPNTETQENELLSAINELKIAHAQRDEESSIINNGLILKRDNFVSNVEEIIRKDVPTNESFDINKIVGQLTCDEVKEVGKDDNAKYKFDQFKHNNFQWLKDQIQYRLSKTKVGKFFKDIIKNEEINLLDKLSDFEQGEMNKSLYINASKLGKSDDSGKMMIDLICNRILEARTEHKSNNSNYKFTPIILFIDEVHRYALEHDSEGNYSTGLIDIAREGRKYGIFMFLTSQSPKDVPSIVLNQIGTLLVHNLTGRDDLKIISNYFDSSTLNSLSNLGQGEALLTSINLIRDVQLKINPSSLIQNNETPFIGKIKINNQ